MPCSLMRPCAPKERGKAVKKNGGVLGSAREGKTWVKDGVVRAGMIGGMYQSQGVCCGAVRAYHSNHEQYRPLLYGQSHFWPEI